MEHRFLKANSSDLRHLKEYSLQGGTCQKLLDNGMCPVVTHTLKWASWVLTVWLWQLKKGIYTFVYFCSLKFKKLWLPRKLYVYLKKILKIFRTNQYVNLLFQLWSPPPLPLLDLVYMHECLLERFYNVCAYRWL